MGTKNGRNVTAAERPVYDQCTRLFLAGRIHAFWAFEKDEWAIQASPEHPPLTGTFTETKDRLRRVDPEGCTWDTGKVTRTGKPALLDLSRRLLAALTAGDCPEALVTEAARLIDAA